MTIKEEVVSNIEMQQFLQKIREGTAKVEVVEKQLLERDTKVRELRHALMEAQNRMKRIYEKSHRERERVQCIGDWVYVKLHLYRQTSLALRKAILDHRTYKWQAQVLVHWQRLSPTEATWENMEAMKFKFPDLGLEGKTTQGGRNMLHVQLWE
ncbi:hypothetical protein Patl1_23535 [Pistacia atlantica]|uniref:Uncharacterized protein n=1 Tax=Pistacia atlantica TaxID=434234 RepID=A0ACC0ZZI7_9ROSI|nr:hypothetical protein Patl1_23535 [Pistacia atlantica]